MLVVPNFYSRHSGNVLVLVFFIAVKIQENFIQNLISCEDNKLNRLIHDSRIFQRVHDRGKGSVYVDVYQILINKRCLRNIIPLKILLKNTVKKLHGNCK